MDARSSYINAVIGQLVRDHGVEVDENDETIRVGLEFEWAKARKWRCTIASWLTTTAGCSSLGKPATRR